MLVTGPIIQVGLPQVDALDWLLLSEFSDRTQLDTRFTIVPDDDDVQGTFAMADPVATVLLATSESLFFAVELKPADTVKLLTQEFETVLYM